MGWLLGRRLMWFVICLICLADCVIVAGGESPWENAKFPEGFQVVWDMSKAYRETTSTRERISINGLWRWQPADGVADTVPTDGWGYFKVPGCWPGITDYMQKDSQTVFAHPKWKSRKLGDVKAAWYDREIEVPADWTERRITLSVEYLNSYAAVFVDGIKAGECRFPAGEVDLTAMCKRGGKYNLSLLVVAMPLKGVIRSYTDTASAREVKGTVARRGLCGDVFLVSTPTGPQIADIKVETSIRRKALTVNAEFDGLDATLQYAVHFRILKNGREIKDFANRTFRASDFHDGRIAFTEEWIPDKLWDIHTAHHRYELELSLLDDQRRIVDVAQIVRFGFREFWIEGRDFYLNGSRIFLSAVPFDNAQVGAALVTYPAARESMERLKSIGINFVYTHNYDCLPGSHLSFAEILRAADDSGILVALSMPHFSHYDWQAPDAETSNGYASLAKFYVRVAQNHPSVIMYATSHNATGYNEDMNPDRIDGLHDQRDRWALNNAKTAVRAESIIRRLDSHRIVYHHASGNLGSIHSSNFYPNFVPIQELSDWFAHWAADGTKPVFLCEYGAPFTWDWAMYRGWYKGKREFGSAIVPWEFCLAEWNAQFFGDRAYAISEMEKRNLRWEAGRFREGKVWYRWEYPHQLGSTDFPEREPVFARYFEENWRAFRTWGISANSPWEHHILFKLRPGVDRNRRSELVVDWQNLQRPGFSPDYQQDRFERMDMAYERSDWIATEGGTALIRNNQPLLAYIGGKSTMVTDKEHIFVAGETFEKQIIVINNSRSPIRCQCSWTLNLPRPISGQARLTIETGQQARIPMLFALPNELEPGEYRLSAKTIFAPREIQEDHFLIHVLSRKPVSRSETKVAIFDPAGQTTTLLKRMGIHCDRVDAKADLNGYETLIIGMASLTVDGSAPDVGRVRGGLKIILFEQTPDVLEKRFGFRIAEYGLRNVFLRVPDHPVLAGLQTEHLRDWRGDATILPPRLKYESDGRFNGAPTVSWCGIPVPRVWRCGNRGNVASVLIEKPACGDFLPILDGGFSLQYSPLMEYREGEGVVLFCQMDVSGRTESDPVAEQLIINILNYINHWKPSPKRDAFYIGGPAGISHLQAAGVRVSLYDGEELRADQVLILGPDSIILRNHREKVATFLKAGGHLLAVGLTQQDADVLLPFHVSIKPVEHINAYFEPQKWNSFLAGVGPADVHNRDPRVIPLVSSGATIVGNGILAVSSESNVLFCQMAPWQFEYQNNYGLKRTFRRSSFLLARLFGNLDVSSETPLLTRLSTPLASNETGRWLNGFYLDQPEEWDYPYRFFRW